jgi:hypothetical protein
MSVAQSRFTLQQMLAWISSSTIVLFTLNAALTVLSVPPPSFAYLFLGFLSLALAVLFLINIVVALCAPLFRKQHIILTVAIAFSLFVTFPLFAKWSESRMHEWFLNEGIHTYNRLIGRIRENSSMMIAKDQALDNIVGRSHVYGRTNADGALVIWFQGRAGYLRAGYLYYNGNQLAQKSGVPNAYVFPDNPIDHTYFKLTNDWYEY